MQRKGFAFISILFLIGLGAAVLVSYNIIKSQTPSESKEKIKLPITPNPSFNNIEINNNSGSQEPDNFKNVTNYLYNPSKTFAFFFRSKEAVFANIESDEGLFGWSEDPTKICFNGDTRYAIPSNKYVSNSSQHIIIPVLLNLKTNTEVVWDEVGKIKAPNGCVRIIKWKDDSQLIRNITGGDIRNYNETDILSVKSLLLNTK